VSQSYWRRQFGARQDAIGKVLICDGQPATIVGVVPGTFYPEASIWRPRLGRQGWPPEMRGGSGTVVARLSGEVSLDAAASELTQLLLASSVTAADTPRVVVRRLLDDAGAGSVATLQVLGGAVLAVLLLGCINVAGLLLARGEWRNEELATRAAIGASRGRLMRQMLTESLVLATAGGAAGVALAALALDLFVANIPMRLPDNVTPSMHLGVLGFALAATVVTALLFGLAPAIRLSGHRSGPVATRGRGRALSRRSGSTLIVAEVSLAIVLLAGAGLMLRSFGRALAVDIGFDARRFMTVEVQPVDAAPDLQAAYYANLVEALQGVPGVEAAGATDTMPLMGGGQTFFARAPGTDPPLQPRQVTPDFVEAIGLRIVEGRSLNAGDRTAAAITGALINESAARRLFPDGSAVGRQVAFGPEPPPGSAAAPPRPTVVGVIGDVRQQGPLSRITDEIYVPFQSAPSEGAARRGLTIVVRPSERNPVTADVIRDVAQSLGPRVVVSQIRPGSDWYGERVTTPRQRTVLLSLLGGLGLVLALIGIFGMTAYAVARRTREIGVRMAFGARPGDVVRRMVRDAAWPIAIGTVVGLGAAALSTRVIESFLFQTTPTDPVTFAVVAAVLATTGLLAAWIPARRAARVDPVSALRAE
jgi:predicted permease